MTLFQPASKIIPQPSATLESGSGAAAAWPAISNAGRVWADALNESPATLSVAVSVTPDVPGDGTPHSLAPDSEFGVTNNQ
jgi:hypothetical protein